MPSTTIEKFGFELTVNTRFGLVESYRRGGVDILWPAAPGEPNPLTSAAYPLIPFSGRIGNAQFEFQDRKIELPKNFPPEPHAIHGFSWEADWEIYDQTNRAIHLVHDYKAAAWPWSYRAGQRFLVSEDGLHVFITLENRSETDMPAGIGWHPFFPSSGASITADVSGYWPSEKSGVPKDPASVPDEFDLRRVKQVEGLDLDHCFQAGREGALIDYRFRKVRISYSEVFTQFIVYNPADEGFFCAEPVSHSPDAANSTHSPDVTGWRTLAPGEMMSGLIRMVVS